MKILVVEDDALNAYVLTAILTDQNYAVEVAADGNAAWDLIETYDYDLILLDVMLPKLDGISLCRQIRSSGLQVPILLLTGCDSSHEKATGLDAGADDYVVKPFDQEELVARVRALLRRGNVASQPVLEWGNLRLDPSSCEVIYDQHILSLTPKEYALLELFLRNNRRVFSCGMILEHLWSYEDTPGEEAVRTHIKGLRQKLKSVGAPSDLVETVYGIGYRLKPQEEESEKVQSVKSKSAKQAEDLVKEEKDKTQQQTLAAVARIWQHFRGRVDEQVKVLEQAANQQVLDSELRTKALQEAHTLAGSLGTFGFNFGSELARKIEKLLKSGKTLNATEVTSLQNWVNLLRQEIAETAEEAELPPPSTAEKPLVLVVDREETLGEQLATVSANSGFQIITATSLDAAKTQLYRTSPSVVLLDPRVADHPEDSGNFLAELCQCKPPVPVLVLTDQADFSDRLQAARNGRHTFLQKPIPITQVLESITQVLQNNPYAEAKILVVDDDPQVLTFLQTLLTPWGFQVVILQDPQKCWKALESVKPDLLILDIEMPDTNGIELCQVIRNDPRWSELPILFLTVHNDAEIVNQVFSIGADDFVSKPIIGPELVTRIINRLERVKLLRQVTKTPNNSSTKTEILRLNRTIQTLTACNQALVHTENETDLLEQICQIIVDIGSYQLAWIGFAENDAGKNIRPVAQAGDEKGYLQSLNLTWADTGKANNPIENAIRTNQTFIIQNINLDPNYQFLSNYGYTALITLPLKADSQTFGAWNIYATQSDAFDADEIALLKQLADNLAQRIAALRNQQELRQVQTSYQQLIELSPEAIFIQSEEKFVFVNSATIKLFGVTKSAELLGKSILDFVHPDSQAEVKKRIKYLREIQQQVPLKAEKWIRQDGVVIDLEVVAAPFVYQGKPAAQVIARDISQRRQTELALHKANNELELRVAERTAELITVNQQLHLELDERQRTQEALRISQTRFEGILSIADDAIISINSSQQITLFNQGAEKIFGYSSEEILGEHLDLLLPMRFSEQHRQNVADFGKAPILARRMGERREIFGRRKNGTEFPAEASISKLDVGEECVYTVILRDITERKQIERMKDEFVSVVSHELRTPLTSIHGSLGLLASGLLPTDSEQGKRLLEIATDSTDRLVRLINDILDIERIESGKVKMEPEVCNVLDLITSAVNIIQPLADKANISLSTCSLSVQIWADTDRIVQTLTNLLSNAIKFSKPGATVCLTAAQQGEEVLLTVKDTGRGIPADKLNSIFERFQQVDSSDSRNHEGTGLGLAICKSIVQQHGGQIWAESVLGEGSSFYFTLPIFQAPRTHESVISVTQETADNGRYRPLILVCDDDSLIRIELQTLLEQRGYRVATVANGEDAIAQAIAQHPDVILLDLLMPGMNGWETMAVLKERPDTKEIPIMICSVYKPSQNQPPSADFVDWLSKPVEESHLLQSLKQVVAEPSKQVRILIVEDDKDLAQLLVTLFERHDLETFVATTGREAIRLSQQVNPDLLILDLILPEMDGFTVVDWLKQHNHLCDIPVVVYSARDLEESERHQLKLGYTEFLTKGRVTTQEFEQRVMDLLQRITQNQYEAGNYDNKANFSS
jgi:PAS domain S-box-containing protein